MKALALDTETTGTEFFHGCQMFSLAACDEDGHTWHWDWPVDPFTRKLKHRKGWDGVLSFLMDYPRWLFHNAKFDVRAIHCTMGSFANEDTWGRVEDTLLMSHVLDSGEPHGLKDLSEKYLGIHSLDEKTLQEATVSARRLADKRGWKKGVNAKGEAEVAWDYWMVKALDRKSTLCKRYNIQDTVRLMLLWKLLRKELRKESLTAQYRRELSLLPIVYAMESEGMPLREGPARKARKEFLSRKDTLESQLVSAAKKKKLVDFNVRSGPQLQTLLYEKYHLPIIARTRGGAPCVDRDTLEFLSENEATGTAYNFLENLLTFRDLDKAVGTLDGYFQVALNLDGTLRVYPSFNQTGTRTTRFSSSNPNAQNVAKREEDASKRPKIPLRFCFGPERGRVWLDIDYSQLELRILAYLADEENMLSVFAANGDIHQQTADLCGIERWRAKNVNFAIVYGAGMVKLRLMSGRDDIGTLFRKAYPGVADFMRSTIRDVEKTGYVTTRYGYRLYPPEGKAYAGVDYTIQGTAGDILKYSLLNLSKLFREKGWDCYLVATIHDEVIISLPKKESENTTIINGIIDAMMEPGLRALIHTPVELKRITSGWDTGETLELDDTYHVAT